VDVVRAYLYPIAWIWPLLLWSAMGNREMRYQTNQLVFSTAHPLLSQLPMQWLTGVLLYDKTGENRTEGVSLGDSRSDT
jgi:hypothetical protein